MIAKCFCTRSALRLVFYLLNNLCCLVVSALSVGASLISPFYPKAVLQKWIPDLSGKEKAAERDGLCLPHAVY